MADDKKMAVLLNRNYKPADGVKTMAGTTIELPVKEARGIIEAGIATRADPLPEA